MTARRSFNLAGARSMKFAFRAKHMKTNPSTTMVSIRRACATAAVMFVGGTSLTAAPIDGSIDRAKPPALSASSGCSACSGPERIVVMLECHQRTDTARLSLRDTRAPASQVRRLRLEIAGLDLLASRPGEPRPSALAMAQPSPFDFAPGARAVGPLRWTWASVAWKF